jgi:DNA-directed RNA polymerase specialized sigma24 family protein
LIHIPVSTVKTRIYRGVMALKPLLKQPIPRKEGTERKPSTGGAQ